MGYVEMAVMEEGKKALKALNGQKINDRLLVVRKVWFACKLALANIDAEKNGVTVWNYIEGEKEEGGLKMF